MKSFESTTGLTEAWKQAWRTRCCPPDKVLAGELTVELKRHLDTCPACRQERTDLVSETGIDLSVPVPGEHHRPQKGELWSILPQQGGWGLKNRYYCPPVVLIAAPAGKEAVQVMQVYGDTALAGPDDILLDNDLAGFVEPWNLYTLKIDVLQYCLGRVSTKLAGRLKDVPTPPANAPSPGSLLWFFRQMEVETGWFFARQSIADLLQSDNATASPGLCYRTTTELVEDLKKFPLILPEFCADKSQKYVLENTVPDDALLSLAAADEGPEKITILVFHAEQGRIHSVTTIPGTVSVRHEDAGFLHIGGSCVECPDSNCEWFFSWQSDGRGLQPLSGQYGAENGVFWAVFSAGETTDFAHGELLVRIIIHQ